MTNDYLDHQIMFVGKDVAKALGYKNPNDALSKHVDDEDKGVTKRDTLGGKQKMLLINGRYRKLNGLHFSD